MEGKKKEKKKKRKKKKKTTRTMGTCSNSDLFPMIIPRSFTRIHASPRYETRGRKAYKLITFSSTFISNSFEQETFGQIENFFSLLLFIPAFLHIISKRSERKRVSQHCVNDFLKFFEFWEIKLFTRKRKGKFNNYSRYCSRKILILFE